MVTLLYGVIMLVVSVVAPFQGEAFANGSVSRFNATGLLSRTDESAGEILIRAHQRDIGAMALVAAGYAKGIGGFPKDTYLAVAWGHLLFLNNSYGAGAITSLLLWEAGEAPEKTIGVKLSLCSKAKENFLAPLFKRADIFDVDTFCAVFDKQKKNYPNWTKEFEEANDLMQQGEQAGLDAMELMRGARADFSALLTDQFRSVWKIYSLDTLIFFAATTHTPNKDAPDWRMERLLEFLHSCRKAVQHAKNESSQNLLSELISAILRACATVASFSQSEAIDCINRAHNAFPLPALSADTSGVKAIRKMAEHYRDGTLGFLKSDLLAQAWLLSGAFDDDPQSTLLLALDCFGRGDFVAAWHWGSVIASHNEADQTAKCMGEEIVKKVKELRPEGLTEEELAEIEGYQKAKIDRLEWRIFQTGAAPSN